MTNFGFVHSCMLHRKTPFQSDFKHKEKGSGGRGGGGGGGVINIPIHWCELGRKYLGRNKVKYKTL